MYLSQEVCMYLKRWINLSLFNNNMQHKSPDNLDMSRKQIDSISYMKDKT